MIGPVEQAVFGQVLGRHDPALRGGESLEVVLELALAFPDQDHVPRGSGRLQDVERQVGDGLLERIQGIRGVGGGAEQAAFLGRPGREDHAALERWPGLEDARDLEHSGDAERVVIGARSHRSSLIVGFADAVRIPVRRRHQDLVGARRSGQHRKHVGAFEFLHGDREVRGEPQAVDLERLEVRTARPGTQLVQIVAGRLQHGRRDLTVQPALQRDGLLRRVGFDDRVILARR